MNMFHNKSNGFRNVELHILRIQYISVFSLNIGKYGPEITPYLGTFHAVVVQLIAILFHLTALTNLIL